ncbi:MAG: hypothetical protein MI747_02810 [Desulfobacterales bacterium]|nr:hypothetical protein [Desulfobacterales bacterium]
MRYQNHPLRRPIHAILGGAMVWALWIGPLWIWPGILPGNPAWAGFDTEDPGTIQLHLPPSQPTSPPPTHGGDWRWTLGSRASLATEKDADWVDAHIWLQGRGEILIREGLYLFGQGRVLLLPRPDHRSEDQNIKAVWRPKEAYAQWDLGNVTLKVGYPILVWGKADSTAVTDIASPRDREDLIFKEVEEMRQGQWALVGEWFRDWGSLQAFASPLAGTDRLPDMDSRYARPLPGDPPVQDQAPDLGQGEAGLRLRLSQGNMEPVIMAGWFRANSPVYQGSTSIQARYPGFAMVGGAVDWVKGNFLVKAETAFKAGYPLQALDMGLGLPTFHMRRADLGDGALGVEYTSNRQTGFGLEISHRRIFSDTAGLSPDQKDRTALFATLSKSILHDTLDLEYQLYYHFRDQDICHGFKADYEFSDGLTLKGRVFLIQGGGTTTVLGPYHGEDRISLELVYNL